MTIKPKCIVVTGRAGAGKTTLAKKLGKRLWMPVISRDEIKEGYVNTFGVKHDDLPNDTDLVVTNFFFEIVDQYLTNNVSVIIEAAFQHRVWEPRIAKIASKASPFLIVCSIDAEIAAKRHLQRGLDEPKRTYYHDDKRVSVYLATGEMGTPKPYEPPALDVPTIQVSTDGEYSPAIDEIVSQLRRQNT
ncbi:MAG TPA: AAA family ATPase [Pyrinomonadaceae bacterium]|nr:AAA family ATPase [Pyrinomonadaceae bacterium]